MILLCNGTVMQNHVIEVKFVVLWGEGCAVGKQTLVGFRGAYNLHFYNRGLRVEIVRAYYDTASVSSNINPVCSGVPICWTSRMDIPRRGWVRTYCKTLIQRFPYFLRRGALFRKEIRHGALASPLYQRHLCEYLAVFT